MKLPSVRSLMTLYNLDRPFARVANFTGVVLVCTVTLGWVSSRTRAFVGGGSPGIDTRVLQWAPAAGAAVLVLGLVLLLRRFNWIHQVVSRGITIKGVVEEIKVRTTRLPAEKHAPWTPRLLHTRYAVVAYDCRGARKRARLKLPSLARATAITEGAEVELMVLESAPGKPLLREVFQNWARMHGGRKG